MPRVLLLATTTGYQTRMFGEAAERLGVELVFATDRCDMLEDPWQDRAIPVRFHDEDTSVAAILERAAVTPIHGILVVGDRPTVIAAMAAVELLIPGHQPPAAAAARNKLLTRERLRDSDLLVPWFFPTSVDADPGALAAMIEYPCVIKPLTLSGSRGVMRADDAPSFVLAFERLRALLATPEVRAERYSIRSAFAGKIDRDHSAAGGAQDLNCQNAYQPSPNDRYRLPDRDVRLAHALHRDRSNRRQRSRLQADILRNADREIAGHEVNLTMVGITDSCARDPVAGLKPGNVRTRFEHMAGA